jgi:hypothetical protein
VKPCCVRYYGKLDLKGKPERVIKRLRLHAIRCGFALGARGKGISGLWLSFQKVIDWVLCEKGEKCFVPLGINFFS